MKKTRDQIANEEATRDPIFLLQAARLIITEPQMLAYCSHCESVYQVHSDHNCEQNDVLTDDELLENGWAEKVWLTEGVYLTREEGECFARRTDHRYPNGWRVYCVPAEGELAKLLNSQASNSSTE